MAILIGPDPDVPMFLAVACALLFLWILGVVAFKITKGVIHLVLLIAIIALAVHFLRGG